MYRIYIDNDVSSDDYDFKLSGKTYAEIEEKANHEGEFIPD